jgi:hypothetical protein
MVNLLTTGDPDESSQSDARQLMGRYTLEEAVQALAKNVEDIDAKEMLKDLKAKVLDGTVKVYAPAQVDISHTPVTVRSYYDEVEWDVLNEKWLAHFDAIGWRYPDPLDKFRPDWSYWKVDHLSLEDAISLSVNITPDWFHSKLIGRRGKLKISFDYSRRLTNALNWAQSPDCVWRYGDEVEFKSNRLVVLASFVSWVIHKKSEWRIPEEFKTLATKTIAPLNALAEKKYSETTWRIKSVNSFPGYRGFLYGFLHQELNNGKQQPPNALEFLGWLKNQIIATGEPKKWIVYQTRLEYFTMDGTPRKADKRAITKAISNLITHKS